MTKTTRVRVIDVIRGNLKVYSVAALPRTIFKYRRSISLLLLRFVTLNSLPDTFAQDETRPFSNVIVMRPSVVIV
jgi:hypothetical protein